MPNVRSNSVEPFTTEELSGMESMTPGERLKALREKRFKTATEAAHAMGIKPVTYTQHEANRGTGPSLPRYARFFHVSVDFLLTGRQSPLGIDAKHVPVVADTAAEGIVVKGYVSAGDWQEAYKRDDSDPQTLNIARLTGYSHDQLFALQIRGESMNRRAFAGSYAICAEWDGVLHKDDVVVLEYRRNGLFQATIKVVSRIRDGEIELMPDSDHPNHQTPIYVRKEDLEEGEEYAIVGRVLNFVSDPKRRR